MKEGMLKSSFFVGWFFHPPSETPLFYESAVFRWLDEKIFRPIFSAVKISEEKAIFLGKWLLAALLFSCVFIPRFSLGYIVLSYSLDMRLDDLLLPGLALLALWVGGKKEKALGISSVERAFLWFLLAAEISILGGFFFRTVDKPFLSLLYLLKWVEYFLVFWATVRLARSRSESDFFLKVFFLLGIFLAGYGYWEHFSPAAKAVYPNYYRLFERFPFTGDANHVGGLLVLWMGFFTGLFLNRKNDFTRALLFTGLCFVFFPLIWTYSRKSYLALGGALSLSVLLQKDRREALLLVCFFALVGLVLPTRLAERVTDIRYAFDSVDPFHSSLAGNWAMWQQALWNFDKFFLWGSGFGSRHRLFYESQFVLVLAETGLFGFAAFLFLCLALVRKITVRFSRLSQREKAIVLGWLAGFSGLMVHNLSCVSLTVTKVAIPFWFLTAVVLARLEPAAGVQR